MFIGMMMHKENNNKDVNERTRVIEADGFHEVMAQRPTTKHTMMPTMKHATTLTKMSQEDKSIVKTKKQASFSWADCCDESSDEENDEDSDNDSDCPTLVPRPCAHNDDDEDSDEEDEKEDNESKEYVHIAYPDDSFFDHFTYDKTKDEVTKKVCDTCLMADRYKKHTRNKWLGDSGASQHVCNDKKLMTNLKTTNESVIIGNSEEMKATHQGDVVPLFAHDDSRDVDLNDALLIPEFDHNIMSLAKFAEKGHKIIMSKENIKVHSKDEKITRTFKKDGTLYYLNTTSRKGNDTEDDKDTAMQALTKGTKVDINLAHELLGHLRQVLVKKTARDIGWKLTGTFKSCDACAKAKAVAKRVTKQHLDEHRNRVSNYMQTQVDHMHLASPDRHIGSCLSMTSHELNGPTLSRRSRR